MYLLSFIDNNKDRKPKRELIAKEKRKLEKAIAAYNSLMSDTETVDTADAVLSQDFPLWPWDSDICIFLHYIACIFISLLFLILFLYIAYTLYPPHNVPCAILCIALKV